MKIVVSISINEDFLPTLKAIAEKERKSLSELIEQAINMYLGNWTREEIQKFWERGNEILKDK